MIKITKIALFASLALATSPANADRWDGEYDSLDRQHGAWSRYSDDDALLEYTIFRHGVKTGNSITYSASGGELSFATFKDDILHGDYYTNYEGDSEILREEGQFKNDLKTGGWKTYYKNGQLEHSTSYFNGREDGLRTSHFASGEEKIGPVSAEANYKNGVLNGEYTSFYDDAEHSIQAIGEHTNNLRSGIWIEYFATGEQKSQIEYVAGVMHGKSLIGHRSGQLAIETTYDSGRLEGEYTEYFDNRDHSKRFHGKHTGGVRDGLWTEWHENGNLASESLYNQGILHGPKATFHQYDGSLLFTEEYVSGSKTGAFISYYFPKPIIADGNENSDSEDPDKNYRRTWGHLVESQKEGEWYEIWGNGNTKRVGYFSTGLENGTWREYTEDGKLTSILEYTDGEVTDGQVDCHLQDVYCDGE